MKLNSVVSFGLLSAVLVSSVSAHAIPCADVNLEGVYSARMVDPEATAQDRREWDGKLLAFVKYGPAYFFTSVTPFNARTNSPSRKGVVIGENNQFYNVVTPGYGSDRRENAIVALEESDSGMCRINLLSSRRMDEEYLLILASSATGAITLGGDHTDEPAFLQLDLVTRVQHL